MYPCTLHVTVRMLQLSSKVSNDSEEQKIVFYLHVHFMVGKQLISIVFEILVDIHLKIKPILVSIIRIYHLTIGHFDLIVTTYFLFSLSLSIFLHRKT